MMRSLGKLALGAVLVAGISTGAWAQTQRTTMDVTVNDPPAAAPDPADVPFTLPKDIKWTGVEGKQQTAIVFGDPTKAGPYGVMYRWYPGTFSVPHFHDQTRWAYVVSGTWWVSTSPVFDVKTTYPMHAGSVVTNIANKVHWDGARAGEKEPTILFLVGVGPMKTIYVGADGKPLAVQPTAK